MNRQQAQKINEKTKNYIEKNKLRHLFSELTKELLLKKPENPIEFLMHHLEKRQRRAVICFQGYDEEKRTKLAKSLANKFNFHLISLPELYSNSDYNGLDNIQVSKKVINEISSVDAVYLGIVVSGFPNNAVQADYLQKAGILPERYFVLYNDEPVIRTAYDKRHSEEDVNLLMERNELQINELKAILGDNYDQLPLSIEKAQEKINSTISIRLKKNPPLDSPRIFVLHPPFLAPKTLSALIDKFSFHSISTQKVFKKMSKKDEFKKVVESHIRQNKSLSKQIELALIETECKSGTAKTKGFIVSGWPNRKQSLPFLKEHFLNPHIIFVFTCLKQKALQQFEKLDALDQMFAIVEKPSKENYKLLLKEYEQIVQALKSQTTANCQFNSLNQSENQIIKTFESLIDNAKIYS